MLFTFLAFFAGIFTVFAPCVFVLLPVIVGGSISGDVHDKRRPFFIVAGAAVSLFVFTLLLKATTLFIAVPPAVITGISGGIIIMLGLVLLFPNLYDRILITLNIQAKSQQLLGSGNGKGPVIGALITGAALGPVFSSCSPVYAYILASVLPVDFAVAMVYMIAYIAGLSAMLLLIGFLGQRIVHKLKWASDPRGWFTRAVAIMFLIVGLLIITGYDKKFQTFIAEYTPFDFDSLSAGFIPDEKSSVSADNSDVFNVPSYKAPEITGIESWINSDPLTIKGLRGKVVLVDFWTYSCINCIRTQPYLRDWYKTYHDSGFEIIGVHAPEFAFERVRTNVVEAAKDAGLEYPIALDNSFATWQAFNNQYWPATYLIDANGNVRREHFGEGEYKEEEQAIRLLLTEAGKALPKSSGMQDQQLGAGIGQTPETYFGLERAQGYSGKDNLRSGENSYEISTPNTVNYWTLGGTWNVGSEGITAVKDGVLRFRVAAKNVYVVTGSGNGEMTILLNGKPISESGDSGSDVKDSKISLQMPKLYNIVSFDKFNGNSLVELRVPAGVELHTFTFGS